LNRTRALKKRKGKERKRAVRSSSPVKAVDRCDTRPHRTATDSGVMHSVNVGMSPGVPCRRTEKRRHVGQEKPCSRHLMNGPACHLQRWHSTVHAEAPRRRPTDQRLCFSPCFSSQRDNIVARVPGCCSFQCTMLTLTLTHATWTTASSCKEHKQKIGLTRVDSNERKQPTHTSVSKPVPHQGVTRVVSRFPRLQSLSTPPECLREIDRSPVPPWTATLY